jgi:GNAT superfamily N-acetyltransferase
MIKKITFERIIPYWNILWKQYEGCKINKVNLDSQKNYVHRAYKYLNQEAIEKIIKPVYVGYFNDDEIIGVASGYETNIDWYRIRGLWVNEKYRRNGIATKIVKYLESKSNTRYIWTVPRQTALKFYQSNGFEIDGVYKTEHNITFYFATKNYENY